VSVRLHAIVARGRRKAVVLRRGPSKLVQLWSWDLTRDRFERGQWLRARVFERRCDLSPRGDLLVYFAAKNRGPIPTYTAISKPPYFTALALFPGMGTYGGGGLFSSEDHLELNHGPLHHALAPGFTLRKGMRVSALGRDAGRGEDDPIQHHRLTRDGWRLVDLGTPREQSRGASIWIVLDPPRVYAKGRPKEPELELEQRWTGIKQTNGPWYVMEHALVRRSTQREHALPDCEWADWDHQGDLLMAREGRLWRARVVRGVLQEPRMLIDLREERFEPVVAPPSARTW
jgi:hypothetical protein